MIEKILLLLFSDHGKPTNFKDNPMNAKRLLALASIRPSVTFHKTMTAEEILVLKKYYEILKPKIPHHVDEVKEVGQPHPTLMYDTAKIKFGNLQNLKNFLETHKKAIECGDELIEYDVNNEGAPSGFVLRNAHDNESVTKFPSEINDAFFAFTCINETADKIETKLGEANLFRVLNWNDTAALCSTNLVNRFINNYFLYRWLIFEILKLFYEYYLNGFKIMIYLLILIDK